MMQAHPESFCHIILPHNVICRREKQSHQLGHRSIRAENLPWHRGQPEELFEFGIKLGAQVALQKISILARLQRVRYHQYMTHGYSFQLRERADLSRQPRWIGASVLIEIQLIAFL
jgi:hypothetical protein